MRFLVVRHPLLRFYSGWHQKFAKTDPTSSQMLKKSQALRDFSTDNMKNPEESMTVDFDDFVALYGQNPSGMINKPIYLTERKERVYVLNLMSSQSPMIYVKLSLIKKAGNKPGTNIPPLLSTST